jgi:hypothetical protein
LGRERDDAFIGSFAFDVNTAIGLAIAGAQRDLHNGPDVMVCVQESDEHCRKVWRCTASWIASTFLNSRYPFLLVLKADPDPAAIVTATIVIIPKMSVTAIPTLMEIPVVRMVVESHTGHSDPRICMPAVTVTVTSNIGGRRGGPKDGAPTDNSR